MVVCFLFIDLVFAVYRIVYYKDVKIDNLWWYVQYQIWFVSNEFLLVLRLWCEHGVRLVWVFVFRNSLPRSSAPKWSHCGGIWFIKIKWESERQERE